MVERSENISLPVIGCPGTSVPKKGFPDQLVLLDDPEEPFEVSSVVYEHGHKSAIYAADFNKLVGVNGHYLATVGKNTVHIYEIPTRRGAISLKRAIIDDNDREEFYAVCWVYDHLLKKHYVAAAGFSGFIKVFNVETGDLHVIMRGHGDVINDLRTDHNNSMIVASVSKDTTVRIWNACYGIQIAILGGVGGHDDQVLSCDWSPDSCFLVSTGMDHSVKMWYLPNEIRESISLSSTNPQNASLHRHGSSSSDVSQSTMECHHLAFPNAHTADLHVDYVDCVRFYGWYLISKGSERMANIYRFGTHKEPFDQVFYPRRTDCTCTKLGSLFLPECNVWFMKFDIDPLGRFIVFAAKEGYLYFFNLTTHRTFDMVKPDYTLRLSNGDKHYTVRQVAFSSDGSVLMVVSDDYSVTRLERRRIENKFAMKCPSPGYANVPKKPRLQGPEEVEDD